MTIRYAVRVISLIAISFLLFLKSEAINAQEITANILRTQLGEAEDYLHVKPSLSAKILNENLPYLDKLNASEQLHWLQQLLRVSITLNDLEQVEQTAIRMLTYPEIKTDKLVSILSSLGIMLRRMGYAQESIGLFNCGLAQPIDNDQQKLSLLLSKGISFRQLDDIQQASTTYDLALIVARRNNNEIFIGSIHNAMGVVALVNNDFPTAKRHLLESMQIAQRISRRSGRVIAGLNLLMLAILTEDDVLYQRLYSPIRKLTLSLNSSDRHTQLHWIEQSYQVRHGKQLNAQEQKELLSGLTNINEVSLHNLLVDKLGTILGLPTGMRLNSQRPYQGDLLTKLRQCHGFL